MKSSASTILFLWALVALGLVGQSIAAPVLAASKDKADADDKLAGYRKRKSRFVRGSSSNKSKVVAENDDDEDDGDDDDDEDDDDEDDDEEQTTAVSRHLNSKATTSFFTRAAPPNCLGKGGKGGKGSSGILAIQSPNFLNQFCVGCITEPVTALFSRAVNGFDPVCTTLAFITADATGTDTANAVSPNPVGFCEEVFCYVNSGQIPVSAAGATAYCSVKRCPVPFDVCVEAVSVSCLGLPPTTPVPEPVV